MNYSTLQMLFSSTIEWLYNTTRSPSINWKNVLIYGALFDYTFKAVLNLLQYKVQCRQDIPIEAKDWNLVDKETFKKSQNYSKAKLQVEIVESTYSLLTNYWIIKNEIVPRIWYFWDGRTSSLPWVGEKTLGTLTLLSFLFMGVIMSLPFDWFKTFVLEERFGFNKSTFGLWVRDLFKTCLLGLLLIPMVAYPFQAIISYFGNKFVPYLMVFILIFSLVFSFIYPVFLAPLFNEFESLEDGPLRTAIENLAGSLNFPLGRIYVVDGSQRSSHSNAYFTGFPWYKQIVLYDTLVKDHSIDEIVAVLAHELGHWKKNHIFINLGVGMLLSVVNYPILLLFLGNRHFFHSVGFRRSDMPIMIAVMMYSDALTPLTTVLTFLQNYVVRTCEYDADKFATRLGKGKDLSSALAAMCKTNLSSVDVHSLYSTFNYSHPIVTERLKAIKSEQIKIQ